MAETVRLRPQYCTHTYTEVLSFHFVCCSVFHDNIWTSFFCRDRSPSASILDTHIHRGCVFPFCLLRCFALHKTGLIIRDRPFAFSFIVRLTPTSIRVAVSYFLFFNLLIVLCCGVFPYKKRAYFLGRDCSPQASIVDCRGSRVPLSWVWRRFLLSALGRVRLIENACSLLYFVTKNG